MALTAAAAAKIAATVLTNDKLRKTAGWIIAAVLSPLIVLLVIVCSFMSGGADHNIEALDLSYYGGMIAGSTSLTSAGGGSSGVNSCSSGGASLAVYSKSMDSTGSLRGVKSTQKIRARSSST